MDGSKMTSPEGPRHWFGVRPLTRGRMALALAVAVLADGLQLLPFLGEIPPVDGLIDAATMLIVSRLIGFHLLLLPTFVVELIPVADMLPTWTGCTLAVIALRRREQRAAKTAATPEIPPSREESR